MKLVELRKIVRTAGGDAEIEFEHKGQRSHVTGYTVERNLDGTTQKIILKTGDAAHEVR